MPRPYDWGDVEWEGEFKPLPDAIIDEDPGDETEADRHKFRGILYANYTTTELLGLTVWADELAALSGVE